MLRFYHFLNEEKNVHMEHLEDVMLNNGVEGVRQSIDYLRALRDMLVGNTAKSINVSIQWDGAPSVFSGIDPRDGKFFVAKKGIFNRYPKVYKTPADIDVDTSGDLNAKLKLALEEFPKLGITGVIQGDFLYSREDISEVDIDGASYITFHPNTIVYAIPKGSNLAKEILASRIGVVWHTRYRGETFETMSATFGEEIASSLQKTKTIWSVDAVYKDVSGSANFNAKETKEITAILSNAGKIFSGLKHEALNDISYNDELLIRIKTFINSKVRAGQPIGNTAVFVNDLIKYIHDYYQNEIDKKVTDKSKAVWEAKRSEIMKYFANTLKSDIVKVFDLYNLIVEAKLMIVRKLDKAKSIGTFLKTVDGYKVTEQEGFVAIDHVGKNAVKLVDRLQFSRANFSTDIIKGWTK